jgi:transposase
MAKPITYVGLDVHKDTIAVALAAASLRGEVREHGKIPNTPAALKALAVKLASAGRELRFCYEAGPITIHPLRHVGDRDRQRHQ